MTFLHKLAQRLARLKSIFGMALIVAVACEQPLKLTDPSGAGSLARIQVSPKSLTILTNQVTQFVAIGLTATGDTAPVAIRWSVTGGSIDRKSTRLNSSHDQISYAVFCLKKNK